MHGGISTTATSHGISTMPSDKQGSSTSVRVAIRSSYRIMVSNSSTHCPIEMVPRNSRDRRSADTRGSRRNRQSRDVADSKKMNSSDLPLDDLPKPHATLLPPLLEDQFLARLPKSLRDELLVAYAEVLRNFRERRWEPAELNGGKLCEITYSILNGHVSGVLPKRSSKPKNMVDACHALESAPATFPRSVRVQIP